MSPSPDKREAAKAAVVIEGMKAQGLEIESSACRTDVTISGL